MIDLLAFFGAPILRSVGGWLQKSLEDNKIEKFELKKLFETIVRVGLLQVFAYVGFSLSGIDNPLLASAIAGFFADKLFGSLKENKNVKR